MKAVCIHVKTYYLFYPYLIAPLTYRPEDGGGAGSTAPSSSTAAPGSSPSKKRKGVKTKTLKV